MRQPFEPRTVRAGLLVPGQPWRAVCFEAQTGSTNEVARGIVNAYVDSPHPNDEPPPAWQVVVTDHQTGGRGRLGRAWVVPVGAAVAVSAIVPVSGPGGSHAAGWLPLGAGLALTRALRRLSHAAGHELTPRLKWPNDVLLADDENRKVSGILCELVTGRSHGAKGTGGADGMYVIVGTGVNVDQTRAELPVPTATSLALAGVTIGREALVVAYLRELAGLLRSGDHGDYREEYERACSTIGATVRVHLPGGASVEGEASGLDDTGALVVRTPAGTRAFAAGDVEHVRRPDGRLT